MTKAPLLVEDDIVHPGSIESVNELRLIFTCCHPTLSHDTWVLKVIAGLTTHEIARAFMTPENTVAQGIRRAKLSIQDKQLPYEGARPQRATAASGLGAVRHLLRVQRGPHHHARRRADALDLQCEALRLTRQLCDLMPTEPEIFGLFALIALSFARAETRVDAHGDLLLVSQQDRARWDRRMIREGVRARARPSRRP